MPKDLNVKECTELGITFPCEFTDNGEYRFRCRDSGGYGYILTKMPEIGCGWENSHYHKALTETIIVQQGWIAFAGQWGDGDLTVKILRPGQALTIEPKSVHNIYLAAGTVVHAVKHGDCSLKDDWFASQEFDAVTKRLTEPDIFHSADFSPHRSDS